MDTASFIEKSMTGVGISCVIAIFFIAYIYNRYGNTFTLKKEVLIKEFLFLLASFLLVLFTVTRENPFILLSILVYSFAFGGMDWGRKFIDRMNVNDHETLNEEDSFTYDGKNRYINGQSVYFPSKSSYIRLRLKTFFNQVGSMLVLVLIAAVVVVTAFILRFYNPIPEKYWAPLLLIVFLLWPVLKVVSLIVHIKQIEKIVNKK